MTERQAPYTTRGRTIFRVEKSKDNPFVMIDRRPIENPELSWRAKGILTYLLSRPDNWIVRLGDLVSRAPDGVYAVRTALKELIKAGHITRREEREDGRFKQYVLEVHEIAVTSPVTNLSQAVKPQAENLTLNNTDLTDIQEEDGDAVQNVFMFYTQEIGLLTPMIADGIEGWLKDVPEKWVRDAITEAAKNGARNWKYTEAILKRWHSQGNQEPAKKPSRVSQPKSSATPQPVVVSPERQAELQRIAAEGLKPFMGGAR